MKAKLVIDKPENCSYCPLLVEGDRTSDYCVFTNKYMGHPYKIPDNCPLEQIIEPTTVHYTLKGQPFGEPSKE